MQVVTIFGSNQGDKYQILKEAITELSSVAGKITGKSSLYETVPWGFECDENFLNQVILFETTLSPEQFLHHCLKTEEHFGRIRQKSQARYTSRPIDIDILFYDSFILDTPELQLPHPRICERNFVLVPLAEIIPDFVHPLRQQTIAELLAGCPDQLPVKKSEIQY